MKFMGHKMSQDDQFCEDCGMSKKQIVIQGIACSSQIQTEDDHDAEEKFELEDG